mmetsp:Transcript_56922/g.144376  ORF Transcript_56922/g.144376 Transcript_56922/m.144376 type:complete len:242 (+) Transcript_56922:175-900(+)
MFLMQLSHSTGSTNCLINSGSSVFGEVPAKTGLPVLFMYTSQIGGFNLGAISSSRVLTSSTAGAISGVCKAAPSAILAWRAPLSLANFANFSTKGFAPPHVAPFGKSSAATAQTALAPPSDRIVLQRPSNFERRSPAMETKACGEPAAAFFVASPTALATRRPSSKPITPAATSAVSSPAPKPATAPGLAAASPLRPRNDSNAAAPARKRAGWKTAGSSSFELGPLMHTSARSKPRTCLAD